MKQYFHRFILSEETPVDGRLFNVIILSGTVAAFIAFIINMFNSTTVVGAFFIFAVAIVLAGLLVYANTFGCYQTVSLIVCLLLFNGLFPFVYFKSGGLVSGMCCWFVLSFATIFSLLKGKRLIFCTIITFVVQLTSVFIELQHPEWVARYDAFSDAMYLDILYSYVVASLLVGAIIRLQLNIYEKEKKIAEEASKSKELFLANMSHEIRTPINAMLGMNEMILRESDQESILEYATSIDRAGNNLMHIINDVLDFSKIESGMLDIIIGEYRLTQLLNEMYDMTIMRSENKNLEFKIQVDPGIPDILVGDKVRICQIIWNLLSNAVKYTDIGSVTLIMNAKTGHNQDDIILDIEVKDTGIGITPEDQKLIFNEFQRVNAIQNRSIEGTGLGLSITKRLVTLMKGTIEITSTAGQGSSFHVCIPQKITDNHERIGVYVPHEGYQNLVVSRRDNYIEAPEASILIVDDNTVNLKILAKLLERTKASIEQADSAQECISLAREKHFDLILLDHMMPLMDGIETLAYMRNEKIILEDTSVVVVTANATKGIEQMYLANGFQDYLSKPIDLKKLDDILSKWLPKHMISIHHNAEHNEKL